VSTKFSSINFSSSTNFFSSIVSIPSSKFSQSKSFKNFSLEEFSTIGFSIFELTTVFSSIISFFKIGCSVLAFVVSFDAIFFCNFFGNGSFFNSFFRFAVFFFVQA